MDKLNEALEIVKAAIPALKSDKFRYDGEELMGPKVELNREAYAHLRAWCDDIIYDKTENTLGDWVRDYGGGETETGRVEFGSWFALAKMLDRRDKEIVRIVLDKLLGGAPC